MPKIESEPPLTLAEWANASTPRVWPRDLAKLTGIHLATAYRLMDGRCWPTFKTAQAIYRASQGKVALWDVTEYMLWNGNDDDEKDEPAHAESKTPGRNTGGARRSPA
jgi:hypothetical protein